METEAYQSIGYQSMSKVLQQSNERKTLVHEIRPVDGEFC